MTRLQIATEILRPMSPMDRMFTAQPTRGPQRYKQTWTLEEYAEVLARSKSKGRLLDQLAYLKTNRMCGHRPE